MQPRETFTLTSFQRKTPDEPKFLSSAKFMGCEANKKVSKCSSNLKGECEDKTFKSQIFNEDNNTRVLFERALTSDALSPDETIDIWNKFLEFELLL